MAGTTTSLSVGLASATYGGLQLKLFPQESAWRSLPYTYYENEAVSANKIYDKSLPLDDVFKNIE